jgi:hypothetical protein
MFTSSLATTTHKHAEVSSWLTQRPPFHVNFTPTYPSCLHIVGRWLETITQRPIRLGSFLRVLAPGFSTATGADCDDRAVRGGMKQDQGPVHLDRHSGSKPGEATAILLNNLRDVLPEGGGHAFHHRVVPAASLSQRAAGDLVLSQQGPVEGL